MCVKYILLFVSILFIYFIDNISLIFSNILLAFSLVIMSIIEFLNVGVSLKKCVLLWWQVIYLRIELICLSLILMHCRRESLRKQDFKTSIAQLQNFGLSKVKVKSLSCVRLLATPWTTANQALCPWDFPGKSAGVGCHCLSKIPTK